MSLGRRSVEEHPPLERGSQGEGLVILRRKPSMEVTTNGNPTGQADRASKVQSVSCDVMSGEPIRMMGYMEKKSKLLGWKRYWFVLDGHLLTYFKSKSDYESLSTFAGSITLGNVSTVRPIQIKHSKGFPMEIVSRNQNYFLRCSEKSVLEEWVLALQETISVPPRISSPIWSDPGVQFYRYSFASVSEWSIADSQGDISGSLSNLPKNFYLRQPRTELNNPPLKYKCQSFANLPLDSNSPPGQESPSTSIRSNQSGMSRGDPKSRYSASLLQLESSPQATELKRELASKLSIGHIVPSVIRNRSPHGAHPSTNPGTGKSQTDSNFPRTSSEPRINQDQQPPVPHVVSKREPESNNSKMPVGTLSQSSSLASIAEGFEPHLSRRPLTLPIEPDEKKKKKGIGNLIQKMFKKEDGLAKRKREEGEMIISGPVDLRAQRVQAGKSPQSLTHSPSTPNFGLQGQSPTKGSEEMINELKKVQLRRKSSENEPSRGPDGGTPTSNLSDFSETYDQKLAKFNRISSRLSSPPSAIIGGGSGTGVSRSCSCRVKSTQEEEEPPVLPPKKRTLPRDMTQMSAYDTPKNNSPLHPTHPGPDLVFVPELLEPRKRKISLRELLTKKNSSPEISFGSEETAELLPRPLPKTPDHGPMGEWCDIDNLDVLSELSEDEMNDKVSLENGRDEPIYSRVAPDPTEAIYEEIKYAKQEINLTELETVEEFGDEEELYDEFVTSILNPSPNWDGEKMNWGRAGQEAPGQRVEELRFSGMTALQEYLDGEVGTGSDDPSTSMSFTKGVQERGGAPLNRLGRSLAVEKLGTLLK